MYTSTATQLNVACERIYEASTEAIAGFFRHTTFSIASCVVSGGLSNVSHSDVYPLCSSSSSCALPLSQCYSRALCLVHGALTLRERSLTRRPHVVTLASVKVKALFPTVKSAEALFSYCQVSYGSFLVLF